MIALSSLISLALTKSGKSTWKFNSSYWRRADWKSKATERKIVAEAEGEALMDNYSAPSNQSNYSATETSRMMLKKIPRKSKPSQTAAALCDKLENK